MVAERKFGGDRVIIEALQVRGTTENPLNFDKDHYLKVSLCCRNGDVVDQKKSNTVKSTTFKPSVASATNACAANTDINCRFFEHMTDFRSDYFSIELKEKNRIGDNKLVGTIIFPPQYFARCVDDSAIEEWFPIRVLTGPNSAEKTGAVKVRFQVPGGFPQSANGGKCFRVQGVKMKTRKLRVSLFEAKIMRSTNPNQVFGELVNEQRQEGAPSVYASVYLDGAPSSSSAANNTAGTSTAASAKRNTAVAKPSFTPFFNETFEFFAECERCKVLTVKLKRSGGLFSQRDVIGVVKIPIQFYLAQKCSSEIDDTFDVLDEKDSSHAVARIHLKLEIRRREEDEKGVQFRRMESISGDGDVADDDANLDDATKMSKRMSAAPPRSLMEELGSILVEDCDEED